MDWSDHTYMILALNRLNSAHKPKTGIYKDHVKATYINHTQFKIVNKCSKPVIANEHLDNYKDII